MTEPAPCPSSASRLPRRLARLLERSPAADGLAHLLVLIFAGGLFVAGWRTGNNALGLAGVMAALGLCWMLLRLRGGRWRDLGLRRPRSWPATLLLSLGGVAAIHLGIMRGIAPLVQRWTGPPDISRFDGLRGNGAALILGLITAWTLAAFGEEMVFRGYLLNRLAAFFGGKRLGWGAAVVLSSLVFGAGHAYQGPAGMILTAGVGVLYALAYLLTGRNLWAPILIHGLYDSFAFIVLFAGLNR